MKDYSISVQIDAPADRVWAVMSDVERWHEWTPTITSVTRIDAGPFAVGARARVRQPKLPPAEWVVTAVDEGRGFEWESRAPGVHVVARHIIDLAASGTRVTLSIQYSGVIGNVIGRLTASLNRRYIALEADGLKRRAEAHAAGVPSAAGIVAGPTARGAETAPGPTPASPSAGPGPAPARTR